MPSKFCLQLHHYFTPIYIASGVLWKLQKLQKDFKFHHIKAYPTVGSGENQTIFQFVNPMFITTLDFKCFQSVLILL